MGFISVFLFLGVAYFLKFSYLVRIGKRCFFSIFGSMEKLFIKNMVCNRCILVVKNELEGLGLHPTEVKLGEVRLPEAVPASTKSAISAALEPLGFQLIDDRRSQLIESIKSAIIALVHQEDQTLKTNLSDYLSEKLNQEYSYLSSLYSEVEGATIEKYYIAQRIERVKELLVYDEWSLSEIASRLNYSSVAYLSNQFKKVTGLTPSYFKKIRADKRLPLDEV